MFRSCSLEGRCPRTFGEHVNVGDFWHSNVHLFSQYLQRFLAACERWTEEITESGSLSDSRLQIHTPGERSQVHRLSCRRLLQAVFLQIDPVSLEEPIELRRLGIGNTVAFTVDCGAEAKLLSNSRANPFCRDFPFVFRPMPVDGPARGVLIKTASQRWRSA